jgi:hypothetical protein
VLAGIATIIPFVYSYLKPATKLVADIYPMEFRLPVDLGALVAATRSNQPMDPAIAHILAVTGTNGFARIDLRNEGDLPVDDIHIHVAGATVYAKGTPNVNDSVVLPSDETGIKLVKFEQGRSITIYVWSAIILGSYTSWDTLHDQFQITFSQGIADKRFHITVGATAEFIDKHFWIFASAFGLLFLLSALGLLMRLVPARQWETPGSFEAPFRQDRKPGSIEISFGSGAPYQETKISQGHVLSTVRIGLSNPGETPLGNCRVYIDKISPEPPLPGGLPILLEGAGFTLRHDDPEKLVDIATHWDHVDKFRFNSPASGGFAETLLFIDDEPARTFVVKIEATGCQRSATFRLSTDDSRALHLDFIGYVY